MKGVSENDIP